MQIFTNITLVVQKIKPGHNERRYGAKSGAADRRWNMRLKRKAVATSMQNFNAVALVVQEI